MSHLYILEEDGKTPLPVDDCVVWAWWFEKAKRLVAEWKADDVLVSTVFLGIDHRFMRHAGEPILWETMVFGGEHDGEMERYSSYEEAMLGHERMCRRIRVTHD